MTWNIEGGQADPDVMAERVEAALAGEFPYWAMSDFSPPVEISGVWWKSLEVAVLSRQPITALGEWDISGRKPYSGRFSLN